MLGLAGILPRKRRMKVQELPDLLKQTYAAWNEDKAPRLGAALAYYTVFSLAPLLIVILGIAGLVFDESQARGELVKQIAATMGKDGADIIKTMLDNANHKGSGFVAAAIGLVTLLLGAGGLFGQLQDALNTIWGVAPRPDLGFMGMVRARFLSFTMVLGTAFLLLVSLALSAFLTALGHFAGGALPLPEWTMNLVNFVFSFGIITLLFAMIYKVLPDAEIQWRDVWVGAAVTAFLFNLGKWGLGIYLAKSAPGSTYGAAGSLVLVLLWVYYAAQILFFGAEFTQVYATRYGSRIEPSPNAIALTPEALARQGMPRSGAVQAATDAADGKNEATVSTRVVYGMGDAFEAMDEKKAGGPDWPFFSAIIGGFATVLLIGRWLEARRERKEQRWADEFEG